tara:strand:- start:95 stop:316 length:222 start_codon:yes stop_codon:yes gene_type:complete
MKNMNGPDIQGGIMKKYSHGELSNAGGKSSNAKPEAFVSKKFKQGELSGASEKPGAKNKGQGLTAMGADKKDY